MSLETVPEKISHGNIEYWANKTAEFLATNPVCRCCEDPLTHFSRVMLCGRCRCNKNYQAFLSRNPGYTKRYQRERNNNQKEE